MTTYQYSCRGDMQWTTPQKPAELTETRLIDAILNGRFPPGSLLPAERELALLLGVTRPTLREALQRLARDGWLEIHQGKATRVKDYWYEGNLGVLSALAQHYENLPEDFVPKLLAVRQVIAPVYARLAVEQKHTTVVQLLDKSRLLHDVAAEFAVYDWEVHHTLSIASDNPIFTLILNGFRDLYAPMACRYFELEQARQSSIDFYSKLNQAARNQDGKAAEEITQQAMLFSLELWQRSVTNKPLKNPQSKQNPSGGAP